MNIIEYLNISVDEVSAEKVILTLPITDEHKQPFGLVHGGINALLAETAGSLGANVGLDNTKQVPVGLDIHTHHLKAATHGTLQAIATPINRGRQIQTWQIDTYLLPDNTHTSSSTFTAMIKTLPASTKKE